MNQVRDDEYGFIETMNGEVVSLRGVTKILPKDDCPYPHSKYLNSSWSILGATDLVYTNDLGNNTLVIAVGAFSKIHLKRLLVPKRVANLLIYSGVTIDEPVYIGDKLKDITAPIEIQFVNLEDKFNVDEEELSILFV